MTEIQSFKEVMYPGRYIGTDDRTQGNWKNRYGAHTVALFNFQMNSAYISGPDRIIVRPPGLWDSPINVTYTGTSSDPRALQNPGGNGMPRGLGAVITSEGGDWSATFTVDVRRNTSEWAQFALYFVDWNRQDISQVVEIYDLDSLNIVAPSQLVSNFQEGRYLLFAWNSSIRFRFCFVRGSDLQVGVASISGLFVDLLP